MRLAILAVLACLACTGATAAPRLGDIRLPPGFTITVYAAGMAAARSLALGSRGTLFVGTREDKVYAVPAGGGKPRVVAKGLESPHGVAFKDGALYVAEIGRILRFEHIEERLADPPKPSVLAELPDNNAHGLKPLRFGPDGMLYYAVGSPCNVCEPPAGYGIIARLDPASPGKRETYARGIRNSVGFDWDPRTRELWFTDNGRDNLGDDVPADELNHAPRPGMNFGFPYCHQGDVPDPRYGREHACKEFTPPARELRAHVASLGMRFYTGSQFPEQYRGAIFIAEHGSWNRSQKIGYRISVVRNLDKPTYETFAEGWLQGQSTSGRPVDVIVAPDGALLVSDDGNGVVYRIAYGR